MSKTKRPRPVRIDSWCRLCRRKVRTWKGDRGSVCWKCVRELVKAETIQRRKVKRGQAYNVEPPG